MEFESYFFELTAYTTIPGFRDVSRNLESSEVMARISGRSRRRPLGDCDFLLEITHFKAYLGQNSYFKSNNLSKIFGKQFKRIKQDK